MFKKFATVIVLLSATSLTLIQTQQPAQAGFLDDVSDFLKGARIGADLAEDINRATRSDGSVDVRQIIRSTQRAVDQVKAATDDAPESEYQAEESEYEPETSEVQESEYEPEESVDEDSEDSEPEGVYEDTSEE
jgi:Sec-independent protein translocase protein TatA